MTGLTAGGRERPVLLPSGDDVARQLEIDVLRGQWQPNERLPGERSLAELYFVSRPVIREALRRLEERGLISVLPARGAFVRELQPTSGKTSVDVFTRGGLVTARHLIVARRMLESEAAALAARHRSDNDIGRLREILAALDANLESDTEVASGLDVAFHESIAMASGNPVIQIMFGSIRILTYGLVLRSLTDRQVRHDAAPIHGVVLEAIVAGDAEVARAAMDRHLAIAETRYGIDLDRPLADTLRQRAEALPGLADLLDSAGAMIAGGPPARRESTGLREPSPPKAVVRRRKQVG